MGFYILNFVKTLIRISLRKEKEKERERKRGRGEEWGKGGERTNFELIPSAKWKLVCILCPQIQEVLTSECI